MSQIPQEIFDFLIDLRENNTRDWFQENRPRYEKALAAMVGFADEVLDNMRMHDHIETFSGKKSLYRIYRDVRFSKNKSPYKSNWGGHFKRATASLRGGYYYQIEPGNTFLASGFWSPSKEDLARIRQEILVDASELRDILAQDGIVKTFGTMGGQALKTAPKGFSRDHPDVDLLRHKGFVFRHDFTDAEALSEDFPELVSDTFQQIRPFLDYMSDVLTTDANGVSLV